MGLGIRNFSRKFGACSLLVCVVSLCTLFSTSAPAQAAAGINQEMNFQGRLLNNQGAIVPDGYYNVEFKIYQDGNGCVSGGSSPCGGSLLWTEDYVDNNANAGVQVVDGYMSVQLGSICAFGGGSCQGHTNTGVNWDSDTLWLSMNIAGSSNTCTAFGSGTCTADGEMTPMKRLSANAYALNALSAINSQELGGVSSSNFVQFATNTLQTNSTTSNSIYINNTSTGNLVDFQTAGVDSFVINNNGNVVFGANATHTLSVATAAASTAGQALTISGGAAGTGASALAGGTLTLDGGAGGGTNGNGGNLAIDAGAPNGTGTAGTISLGTNYASSITIGNSTATLNLNSGSGGINLNNNVSNTTNINTGSSTGAVNIGNGSAGSTGITASSGNNVTETAGATSQKVANAGVTIKTTTNSATALQIQNTSGYGVFTVSTSTSQNILGNVTSTAGQGVNGVLAFADGGSDNESGILELSGALGGTSTVFQLPVASNTTQTLCTSVAATCSSTYQVAGNYINNSSTQQTGANFNIAGEGQLGTLDATGSGTGNTLAIGSSAVSGTSGVINVGTSDVAGTINVGGGSQTGAITIGQSTATNTINIGSANTATGNTQTISIGGGTDAGTGKAAVTIGNTNGASSTTIAAGTGAVNINTGAGNATNTNVNTVGTGAVSIGNSSAGNTSITASSSNTVSSTVGAVSETISNTGDTIKTTGSLASALQIQNSSSYSVLDVDTSANQVVIGTASHVNGQLLLQSSGGANYVGFAAPTTNPNSSYVLSLPSTAPSANNQCLQTSATFTQLAFGPCGTSGSFINNAFGTTQAGNFNIQGVSSTVATAVIEANNGGTGDILDLLNGGGTPVATFDKSGNLADSATGTSSFSGTLTVATEVETPTIDTVSGVPLNVGTTNATQVNLNQKVYIASGTNSSITVATPASGNGSNFQINGSTGASGATNGGNVSIDAGAKGGAGGTDGTVNIGTNHASAVNIGNSSATTTNNGNLAVNGTASVGTTSNNGTLVFNSTTGSGGKSITLNTAGSSGNYTLTLPSSAPAAGLCLETAPGSASQLVFASCTNNNSSIQEVQEADVNNTNVKSFTPTTIGDEIVVMTQTSTASSVTVSSITDSDVTTWSKVAALNGNGTVNRVEMWVGTVTSLGTTNLTVNYAGTPGSNEIAIMEFTAAGVNASTSWGIESSGTQLNSVSSATVNYPSATSVDGSELYIGYAQVQNPPATSSSYPNFSYYQTSTQHNMIIYNTDLSANTTYNPTANQNSSGESNTVEGVLTAFVTSTSINNTTSLQKANFYVQAASSGTVAGILQAASSGTADIFDIKNSGGTANYLQVGSTGVLTLNPATTSGSPVALQVLNNTSGYSVFSVDSYNNQTILGASNHVAGTLTFDDTSDTNTISLQAPTTIAASYTLSLPSNSPTAGLCLGTSPSNANQLIFASCATQVSAAGISYVSKWQNTGTGTTTVTDVPVTKGDLLVLFSHSSSTTSVTVSGVSGGGVSGWTKVTAYNSAGGTAGDVEMWRGVINTVGSGTITVTYSGTVTATDVVAQEYTMGSNNGTWAIDTSGTTNATTGTAINYPSLTAQNSSELYTGYAWGANTMSAGTTTGFTYLTTAASKYLAYDPSVTGGIAYVPAASQGTSGAYATVGAMIEAYAGTSVIVSTTATQEANFNVQAATAGTVAGVLQAASSGTADIFDARDSSGSNIVAVNAASGLTLGTSNTVGGQLNFNASGNSNTITIQAPSAPGASYTLSLPTTTPAAGQCLATSPSNQFQLVFSSCANQVTSVAISLVTNWKVSTTGLTPTLAVSPVNLGDLMTVFIYASKSNTVTSVSGGGVTTWSRIVTANSMDMWRGIVTSTGSSNISVNLTTPSGPTDEIAAQEWTTGSSNGSWVVDTSGTITNSTGSTTVTYPSLTPQSTKDLYIGYAAGTSTMSAGTSSGYSYFAGGGADFYGTYNTAISTTTQPTANQSGSGTSFGDGALIAAYSSSSVIANSTVTQQANFNIQAAYSGSVAGVLEAAFSSPGDILDLQNNVGTNVDTFSSTGNALIEPSTASADAFRVQTTGGINVFDVDTNANLVNIGAGATGESSPSLLVLDNETGTSSDPTITSSNGTGAMYYNVTSNAFRCSIDGTWENCNSLLYANTSASSVNNNCSNNCVAFSNSATIPANYCQAGRVIDIYANGYFSSQATASTLQFGVYYGTNSTSASSDTLLGTLSPAATVTSASSNYFQMNYSITCFSTSSMQSGGLMDIQTGSSGSGMLELPLGASTTTTVVTSSAKSLYIFPIWSTASSSNTATLSQLTVNNY